MAGRSSRWSDSEKIRRGFFEPRSIAVIGASTHPDKVGYAVLANILKSGYEGDVYPVNPRGKEIQGLKSYHDVNSIPATCDLALVIVPAAVVPAVVGSCVEKDIKAGVVISAGFREVGIEGRRLERQVVDIARKGDMRLLGPNCLGIMNTSLPLNASFSRRVPPAGTIGVLSQSGAICTSLIDIAKAEEVGFSKLVSLGNSADLVESDFLEALARDEETNVISVYLEGVSDGRRFFEAVRKASRRKPVVFLKAGGTQAGARAASSHTGALAGSERAYEATREQAPALRAYSLEELVEMSRTFATQSIPRGPRVAIITNAGGPGIIASDACEKAGMTLASISGKALQELERSLPEAASTHNPVDVLGDADALTYAKALEIMLADPGVDAVLVILTPQAMTEIARTAEEIIRIARRSKKTLVCSFLGAGSVEAAVRQLQKAGIPNIDYPDRAMHVLGRMYERTIHKRRPVSKRPRFEVDSRKVGELFASYVERDVTQVSPEDCRRVLDAYGIPSTPFRFATDIDEAKLAAEQIGYPVALKVSSAQVIHKSDVGGVRLNVRNARELKETYEDMVNDVRRKVRGAKIDGVAVQKMAMQGKELIIGLATDPQFGPLIMVGFGGIYVEAFDDVAFRLAPMTPRDASRMIHELKAFPLLQGIRGEAPSDVTAVEEVLLRTSQMAAENPRLLEMDINPLMVYNSGHGCTCVDVRMTVGGR